ncbi:hypothetical protein EYF80_061232 [Liparis tanakae]|uniref:Uncharacterized protein n=1 Tax=Liparis tanakae TaxID=230148 RepID=A0A4Z2EJ18_9TELE|nr:hypothetical protein EYF80_061232 [Liparis tanakae]
MDEEIMSWTEGEASDVEPVRRVPVGRRGEADRTEPDRAECHKECHKVMAMMMFGNSAPFCDISMKTNSKERTVWAEEL